MLRNLRPVVNSRCVFSTASCICDELNRGFPIEIHRSKLQKNLSPINWETQIKTLTNDNTNQTSVLMELTDRVGVLHDVLKYFWKHDVNISRIESRPAFMPNMELTDCSKPVRRFDFFVDFDGQRGDTNIDALLRDLLPITDKLLILDNKEVHWFPRHISELDKVVNRTLDAGTNLESDHPGFNDLEYRQRRAELAKVASEHSWDKDIPRVKYTDDELSTWTKVYDVLEPLWRKYACQEYLETLEFMKENCGYGRTQIPQQQDITDWLRKQTGFRMRPVAGLLSSRDFLNGLAFRVFFSTQYIRHHSMPLYTPEPDICHELLGHAPMLADRDFADFSQEIGLASLGASDEDIQKLARCYWHSVEFGLCREGNENKAYGAGLLSSFGELEYACADNHPGGTSSPEIKPWNPIIASHQEFPITTYQPIYFVASSLQDAKEQMRAFCEDLPRPFFAQYNPINETVQIDRPVKRTTGSPE